MIPALLLPLVTKLAENGLNILAGAITAKGKDVVEKTLGVDLESATQSEEGLLKLRELEIEHEEFLVDASLRRAEIDLEEKKADIDNTKSARDMNSRIQESAQAAKLAKEAPYYLDFLVIGATLILATILLFNGVPAINEKLVYMAFGSLLTMCGTILNFHRGTSSSSKSKDESINQLLVGDRK